MAAKKDYRGLSPAEQRAARDQRLASQVDHVELAKQREMKMVANLGQFTDECRWFMANKVWLTLGYETFVGWWADRIAPVVESLGLKPGPELTQLAIEAIQKEEEALPSAQRHTKKAISAIVGASDWKVRARQDPRQRRPAAGADLGDATAEVIDGEVVLESAAAAAEVVDPIAAFDAKYSPTAADVPEHAPADGAEVAPTTVEAPAGDGPRVGRPVPGNPLDPSGDAHEGEPSPEVDSPAAQAHFPSSSSAHGQPGPDSSATSEAEAPAGRSGDHIDVTDDGVDPAIAAGRPGIDPPVAPGEEPTDDGVGSPVESAAGPLARSGAGDEVEGGASPPPEAPSSTDPASEWMQLWRVFIGALESLDIDVVSPMLTDAERAELDADYPYIGKRLTALGVWQDP